MSRVLLTALFLLFPLAPSVLAESGSGTLPVLDQEIAVADWYVVGPFLTGSREPLVDPLGATVDRATTRVDLTARYPSVQEFGGEVAWQPTTVDAEGNLTVNFTNADWEKITDEWGFVGTSFLAAAYSEFQCAKRCRALADAQGVGSFYINGRLYSGDPYGHGLIRTPVILDEGENRVLLFLGGYGGSDSVSFRLSPPENDLMILDRDVLLPDLVRGESLASFAGIPIVNTTERWLDGIRVSAGGGGLFKVTGTEVQPIPPLCVVKVPVPIITDGSFPESWEGSSVELPVTVYCGDTEVSLSAGARVRSASDSRRVTFISGIDNSVQKYAVLYPEGYDPSRTYSLILTLHGAGVECDGQVDAFEPKDWAFVVAPTNRRAFGFDWQDWGRLDALEVLEQAIGSYPIDPDRVYLVGHSMGGHGTWHVGCTHADRFAAVVPSAGWASFQLYVPWFLRMDEMCADPRLAAVIDSASSPDRTERLLPNLLNTPVLAVHGGDDDNVPPTHARLLTGLLERMGYDVRLWEEPEQGHWWDAHPGIPGADCVDALRIRSFLQQHVRDPYPRHVRFVSYDLGNNNRLYWVRVDEEVSPIGRVFVDIELVPDGTLVCTTQNVKALTLDFAGFPYRLPGRICIDGQSVSLETDESGAAHLQLTNEGWKCHAAGSPAVSEGAGALRKTAEFRGPMKRACFRPFVLVVGTQGTENDSEFNLEIARSISQRWWYRANGYTTIVRDVDVDETTLSSFNLVLIGGPQTNSVSARVAGNLPISVTETGVQLGDMFIRGEDLACKFVYPNPLSPDRLILAEWGTSREGMRLAGALNCMYSGSSMPDFLVYDDTVRLLGYAGVRAAGFFDNEWHLDPALCYTGP